MAERDPAHGQTEASVGAYLARCSPGDPVAVHLRDGRTVRVVPTRVSGVRNGRVYTADRVGPGRAWYLRTGRSCWHPKGDARLVEPTGPVVAHARGHPGGAEILGEADSLYGTDGGPTGSRGR